MGKKQKTATNTPREEELHKCLLGIASKFLSIVPAADRKSFNRIGFHVEAAWWFYTDYCRPATRTLPNLNFRAFAPLLLSKQPGLLAPFGGLGALPRLLDAFFNYRSQIPVCGAAIFDSGRKRVLLVRGLHSASKWSFPRGKMNAHESAAACAIREVWEEVGYDIGPILREECRLEWIRRGQHPIRIYVVTLPEGHEQWPFEPQTMGEIGEIGWHRLEALRKFRTTYFDVNQFERGLKKFSKDPDSLSSTLSDAEERLVMKKVSLNELFPLQAQNQATPNNQSTQSNQTNQTHQSNRTPQVNSAVFDSNTRNVEEEDDSTGSMLDPSERVLQIVDDLKLTDWLPTTSLHNDEAQDLFDLLTRKPTTTTTTGNSSSSVVVKEELLAKPKRTPSPETSSNNSNNNDHRDLISLILFGK